MSLRRTSLAALLGGFLLCNAAPVLHAEEGDYTPLQVLLNLISPPKADHPVTPDQRLGPYPLLSNPAGFADGFKPGAYDQWQTIQLAPETGAICGNGSPYKFFLLRSAQTTNTVVYMEGGGACWDYGSCTGQSGIRGARNPNGIPDNYMTINNPGALLVSPFVGRLNLLDLVNLLNGELPQLQPLKTQQWNIVYAPYCTGDIYSGDRVAVYPDPSGQHEPLIWHHNGLRNERAMLAWLKDHLPRPGQMLSTGCSAGGTGSLTNYAARRKDMGSPRSFLLDDSGPIFSAPTGGSSADYPSAPLFAQIRQAWGLDAANGPLNTLQHYLPTFDRSDMGSIYPALSAEFPNDRLGHTHFWQDLNYSSYSYERFYPEIANAPDEATKERLIHQLWAIDTSRLRQTTDSLNNFGGYFPQYRSLNESHCTTIVDLRNGDIQDQHLELIDFINNVLDGQGRVLHASEASDAADRAKPVNPLYVLVNQLLSNGL